MASSSTGSRPQTDLKIIILGDKSVGKTSFIQRFHSGTFISTMSTIGVSLINQKWSNYNVAIWDTAGEEKFAAISNFFTRGAHAAILAYDVTSRESFDKLSDTFVNFLEDAHPNCLCVVVGMKSDLLTDREAAVPASVARELSVNLNLKSGSNQKSTPSSPVFFTTSAKTGENVENVFEFIQSFLFAKHFSQANSPANKIIHLESTSDSAPAPKESCC